MLVQSLDYLVRMFEKLADSEGVQSASPPNMPLRHIGYFEPKALEKERVQPGCSDFSRKQGI